MISKLPIATAALTLAFVASPSDASVTFNVTGTYDDGGTVTGTFTTDDALTTVQSTSLTVAGGTLGLDSVIFNQASYISAGSINLPTSFELDANSSVNKSISLFFSGGLTVSGAALTSASSNYQQGVGTRFITSGSVTNANPTAVPEPASWTMMLVGFAGTGFALRRRKWSSPQLA